MFLSAVQLRISYLPVRYLKSRARAPVHYKQCSATGAGSSMVWCPACDGEGYYLTEVPQYLLILPAQVLCVLVTDRAIKFLIVWYWC